MAASLLAVGVLCGSCVSDGPQKPSPSPTPATTVPASQPNWASMVTPVEPQIALLLKQQQIYMKTEAPGRRAKEFETLATRLMMNQIRHKEWTLLQVFSFLGMPDAGQVDEQGAVYIYYFDRFGVKDGFIMIDADANHVNTIGVNAVTELGAAKLQPYKDWADVRISPVK